MTRFLLMASAAILAACSLAVAQEQPARSRPKMTTQDLADWLDRRFDDEYKQKGVSPAEAVDDATFLRRAFLDLQGRIPTVAQTREFVEDSGSFKRQDYVDRLLNDDPQQYRYAQRPANHPARVSRRMMVPANAPVPATA